MDDEDGYLLSGHLGPGILYVIDVRTNRLIKAIAGVPGITGLEYVPGLRKAYTSDWGEKKIGIVDLHKMSVIKRLPTVTNGSTYASPYRKVYVSDTLGKAVAVVDVDDDEIVKTLRFNSETGMPQYDSAARKVYVNLRSTNEVAEIVLQRIASWVNILSKVANSIMGWRSTLNDIAHFCFVERAGL